MLLQLDELSPATFLKEYWQKKPLVIRQGLPGFQDLLSPDELAGLACDELVESRRVYRDEGQWQAEFGPFDSYQHLGESDWTLIVQAVDNWVPAACKLVECFDFIPRWRLDDVMVSYGTPGGGVGPHIDLYDVFICQGSGSRRWRVGDRGPHREFAAHPALLHTDPFEAIIDTELVTGDILYIPPGFPHDGVTLESSMSFSVGYRTASARDMHRALTDHLIQHDLATSQIEDPGRSPSRHSGKIDESDLNRIRQHLRSILSDELIGEFAGRYLTTSKCELDLPGEKPTFSSDELLDTLARQPLLRLGGSRCLYLEDSVDRGVIYLAGERFELPMELAPAIVTLCDQQTLSQDTLGPWLEDPRFVEQLTRWVNEGYWYFEEAGENAPRN